MNNNEIPEKWKKFGIDEPQQLIDAINEAFSNKEKLDSNIYIGNSKLGNICICLTPDNKIENAFPVKTTREEYFQIKSDVEKLELGNNLYTEVLSLFLAIDIKNHKEELVNVNFSKKVPFLIIDNEMSKNVYALQPGGICDLSTTIIANLEIQPMEGMTGKNLVVTSSGKSKKQNSKTLVLVVGIIAIAVVALFALMLLGII